MAFSKFEDGINAFIQGASHGIGLGFVEALLLDEKVAMVFASSRRPEESEELMALKEKNPDRLELVTMDVTHEDDIEKAFCKVSEQVTELHFLFNVAGILHGDGLSPEKKLTDLNFENLQKSFAVNAFGPAIMMKYFHPLFRHGKHAVLANMSARVGSIGDNGLGGWYGYRASKAAQNQFTRTASIELGRKAPETVVVALHPGTVDTQLSEPFQSNVPEEKLFSVDKAVTQLIDVIDGLDKDDSGKFFDWAGEPVEW